MRLWSQVRRSLRAAGLSGRCRLRRRDRSLRLRFGDGSAARVFADHILLEDPGAAPAPQAGLFARVHARLHDWLDNHDGRAWPFPRPTGPGMPLAGTAAALRQQIARRLGRTRFLSLDEDEARSALARRLLHREFPFAATAAPAEATVLLLTPDCQAELARSPDRHLPRLRALHARHPDLAILPLGQKDIPSHSPTLAELLRWTEARVEAEVEAANPEEDASPSPEP